MTETANPDAWIGGVIDRHLRALTTSELTRAIRALSVRYVERRATIAARSPLDSAGKRAAFAAFYAPLHFLTTSEIVRRIGAASPGLDLDLIVDLGCGTGVASAAWALALSSRPWIHGIDASTWALAEASWNWRQLGLASRTTRGDLVRVAEGLLRRTPTRARRPGVVSGWSANELNAAARARLLTVLVGLSRSGSSVLVLEPLSRAAAPWWPEWTAAFIAAGGRADEWKMAIELPLALSRLDEAAGFQREHLSARSLWLNGAS